MNPAWSWNPGPRGRDPGGVGIWRRAWAHHGPRGGDPGRAEDMAVLRRAGAWQDLRCRDPRGVGIPEGHGSQKGMDPVISISCGAGAPGMALGVESPVEWSAGLWGEDLAGWLFS
jgi:hypothetical protein